MSFKKRKKEKKKNYKAFVSIASLRLLSLPQRQAGHTALVPSLSHAHHFLVADPVHLEEVLSVPHLPFVLEGLWGCLVG